MFDGDEGWLTEEAFLHDFAGDVPPARARILYAAQEPYRKALTQAKTTNAAWRVKPSYYTLSTADRTIIPDLQRFMADRMGVHVISLGEPPFPYPPFGRGRGSDRIGGARRLSPSWSEAAAGSAKCTFGSATAGLPTPMRRCPRCSIG